MKIKKIGYSKLFSLEKYENQRITFECEVDDNKQTGSRILALKDITQESNNAIKRIMGINKNTDEEINALPIATEKTSLNIMKSKLATLKQDVKEEKGKERKELLKADMMSVEKIIKTKSDNIIKLEKHKEAIRTQEQEKIKTVKDNLTEYIDEKLK